MQKQSNIYVTLTNNVVNFKIRIPWQWCKDIGVTEEDRSICIGYKNNKLCIEKRELNLFSTLDKKEKTLQIKKYMEKYYNENIVLRNISSKETPSKEEIKLIKKQNKLLIKEMEDYFKVSYRTIYRYMNEEASEEVRNTDLIEEQDDSIKKVGIIISKHINERTKTETITATLTIPTNLAILLLSQGRNHTELGIKTVTEFYDKATKIPVITEIKDKRIYIYPRYNFKFIRSRSSSNRLII